VSNSLSIYENINRSKNEEQPTKDNLPSPSGFYTMREKNGADRMNCKISRNAAKMILKELEQEENKELKLRVYVTHKHGNHAHYGMKLDHPRDNDVTVMTDKQIEVILDKDEPLLEGIRIDYFYLPEEGFAITNPSKGNHGDH
jgi:Fe-S cluster assembly iron-binding protein IscA